MTSWHLAQLNVARLRHPLDHPDLASFVDSLAAVNAVADAAPGFVWRLQEESGDATGLRPWGEDMIVNLSVWRDIESLHDYVFGPDHVAVLRRRREYFVPMDSPSVVLWWVPAGHRPGLDEAGERLDHLAEHGPSAYAFTFRSGAPAPTSAPPADGLQPADA
jgi:hypothetical protein